MEINSKPLNIKISRKKREGTLFIFHLVHLSYLLILSSIVQFSISKLIHNPRISNFYKFRGDGRTKARFIFHLAHLFAYETSSTHLVSRNSTEYTLIFHIEVNSQSLNIIFTNFEKRERRSSVYFSLSSSLPVRDFLYLSRIS